MTIPCSRGVVTRRENLYIHRPTMTAPRSAPRPPSRWLFAAFAYALVTVAVTMGLSLQTPWLGLRLAP